MTSLSNRVRRSPLPLLLGGVTALSVLRHLLALRPDLADLQWQVADVSRAATLAVALGAVLHLLPWAQLRLSCFVAALIGYYVTDAALCALWYWGGMGAPHWQALWQGAAFVAAGAFYLWRSYDRPREEPESGHVYCLRRRPRSVQGFIIALLGVFGAHGEYAIYAADHVYRFHRGKLEVVPYSSRVFADYVAVKGAPICRSHILALDAMRGVKWQLFGTNCLTLLGAFWHKHGRQ